MPDTYVTIPYPWTNEGSSVVAVAYFRTGETADAPTTAKYRLDCLATGKELKGWTALTPAASISITLTATDLAIQDQRNKTEKKQLTVAADPDTNTQTRGSVVFDVKNLRGI